MNRSMLTIGALAAVAGLAGALLINNKPTPFVSSGKIVSRLDIVSGKKPARPAFTLPDRKGNRRNINEWNGKVILLNFWATWCPPCRKEMPAFIALQKKYGTQGFQVIGVAIDQPNKVEKFANEIGVNYPILIGSLDATRLSRQYGNAGGQLPYSVFIDQQGKLVAVKRGELKKELAEKMIIKLLKTL